MRAKFVCDEVANNRYGAQTVKLTAVTGGSEENKDFNVATPNGDLSMYIDNPNAFGFFIPNTEYYLDFTAVES